MPWPEVGASGALQPEASASAPLSLSSSPPQPPSSSTATVNRAGTLARVRRRMGPERNVAAVMRVLASYNVKGGVGKTTTVVNLAHRAAATGARTLVFDLDPQGAASYYLRANPKVKRTGKALMRAKQDVDSAIVPTDFEGLDLVPADFSFRNVDVVLDGTKNPTERLARLVRP